MSFQFRLPQQPPYDMIHRVLDHSSSLIRCEYTVASDNPLLNQGRFSAEGMIECMAQAAAAKASLESDSAGIGYLVLVRSFRSSMEPVIGSTIEAELELIHDVHPFKIFRGVVRHGGTEIASGEIRTFENS